MERGETVRIPGLCPCTGCQQQADTLCGALLGVQGAVQWSALRLVSNLSVCTCSGTNKEWDAMFESPCTVLP